MARLSRFGIIYVLSPKVFPVLFSRFCRRVMAGAASCLCALATLSGAALAQNPPAPVINAKAWMLLDVSSGQVLASQHPAERIEPASLTKLMTAYLVFAALKAKTLTLEQTAPVSPKAWKMGGSRMFIEPQKPVTVAELLRGMIVQSGNDASVALAELIAGSEQAFAAAMNREAKRLGMKHTNFRNATGWPDPEHLTTAADLAVLAGAVIRDFPDFYALYALKEYAYNNITQVNRNKFVDRPERGRHENRPHRIGRLLPDLIRQTRPAPPALGGDRRCKRECARD